MKYIPLIFLFTLLISCTKEKDTIAEKNADDYTIEWVKFDYDSIKGSDKNYELIELFIPKDKSKDTLRNQIKLYNNGKLDKAHSQYYDLKVEATEKKHTYLAKIKMYSRYSNLVTDKNNRRIVDVFFLNYYKDSLWFEIKHFENVDNFEIEFTNFHNDRFTGRITEYVDRDTIIDNERKVIGGISKMILTNKKTISSSFIEKDSILQNQKISLKEMSEIN